MTVPVRYGVTVPLPGPLHSHQAPLRELADLGYTDLWSAETDGADGMTPLIMAAAWEPRLRLGTAILPAFTRTPALMAQTAASLADAAPGRAAIGIGSSSNVIVERWNGVPFVQPYQRVRDTVRFLRAALTGEKVTETYETFAVNGFRLALRPEIAPSLVCVRACFAWPGARPMASSSTGSRRPMLARLRPSYEQHLAVMIGRSFVVSFAAPPRT
jgi:alkanesulfonate monooxygenase SsuD/methylene tetrahydromethanopterin reductase-like flavin-dependent oxidoreductase (luciferase family)